MHQVEFFFRRNQGDDREQALIILKDLCERRATVNEWSNDVTCLVGRIYKDKFTESHCEKPEFLEEAIKWYRRGFEKNPNI